jgi:hypothetical protein
VWRPSEANWYIIPSSTLDSPYREQWGNTGDVPVPGDYDGDGYQDLAVWTPSTGNWNALMSSSSNSSFLQQWGLPGDVPVVGDYDADGLTDFVVWRPTNQSAYLLVSSQQPNFSVNPLGLAGNSLIYNQPDLAAAVPNSQTVERKALIKKNAWRKGSAAE